MMKVAGTSFLFLALILINFALLVSCRGTRNVDSGCQKDAITIVQGEGPPRFDGTPTYTVEIMNNCRTGCVISDLHLSCGWFSSATVINPRVFKRIAYNDCLVNDGTPLHAGKMVAFRYATTFKFPLSVSSFKCL